MDILLCNKFDDAIVSLIVKRWKDLSPQENKIGRTIIQKISYFLKAKGVPLSYDFEIHHYGPYSQELYFRMDDLLIDKIIIDKSKHPNRSEYEPGSQMEQLLVKFDTQLNPYKNEVDNIISMFNSLPPTAMELFATIHYLHNSYRNYFKKSPGKNMLIDKVKEVKMDKFPRIIIEKVYEIMVEYEMFSWHN